MTSKSRSQVDKEVHIRRTGGKVPVGGLNTSRKLPAARARSAAQVDKEVHIRSLGGTVAPRGKDSDAASGRGTYSPAAKKAAGGKKLGSAFNPSLHPRKADGEFRRR